MNRRRRRDREYIPDANGGLVDKPYNLVDKPYNLNRPAILVKIDRWLGLAFFQSAFGLADIDSPLARSFTTLLGFGPALWRTLLLQ
jgi:hypothetical protein